MTDPRHEEQVEPVVRDKRRIDPVTGSVRPPAETAASAAGAPTDAGTTGTSGPAATGPVAGESTAGDVGRIAALEGQLVERTADLQRLQAEFANYRKRVERDRLATQELALANVLANLLPVLDDIGRAREHGELEGGFKSVAEALEGTVAKLGLEPYGQAGEPFDPTVHEALMHSYSAEVDEPTAVAILQPGYRLGERVLRPARVAVAEPSGPAQQAAATAGDDDQ